jgi:hypothetical protein
MTEEDDKRAGAEIVLLSKDKPLLTDSLGAARSWRAPSWVTEWPTPTSPWDQLPVPLAEIGRQFAAAEKALEPASKEAIAVLLDPLAVIFGYPLDWQAQWPMYLDHLRRLPAYALHDAVQDCIGLYGCKFFPKLAEIGERLPDQYREQGLARLRLEMMLRHHEWQQTYQRRARR